MTGANIKLTVERNSDVLASRMIVQADGATRDGKRCGYGIALLKTASQDEIDAAAEKAIARVKVMFGERAA